MPGHEWRPEAANWKIEHAAELVTRPSEVAAPPIPSDIGATISRWIYLAGQGGSGKMEWAVRMFQGRKMFLCSLPKTT